MKALGFPNLSNHEAVLAWGGLSFLIIMACMIILPKLSFIAGFVGWLVLFFGVWAWFGYVLYVHDELDGFFGF